jgi:hypothetical protein
MLRRKGGQWWRVLPFLLSLQLCLQAVQQIGVDAGIDFLQDLLGTLDGQRGHLLAQGFTGSNGLLVGFGAGSSNNLVAFFCRAGLGFFDDGLGAAFGVKPRLFRCASGPIPVRAC